MRRLDLHVVGPYAVALLASCFFYYHALQIAPAPDGQLGPDLWPKTILFLVVMTCLWEMVRALLSAERRRPEPTPGRIEPALVPKSDALRPADEVGSWAPWIGIAVATAYVAAFPWIGYPLATFFFVATFVFLGNYPRPLVAATIALAASLGFMFLFMRIVYVSLPIGVGPFATFTTTLMSLMHIK